MRGTSVSLLQWHAHRRTPTSGLGTVVPNARLVAAPDRYFAAGATARSCLLEGAGDGTALAASGRTSAWASARQAHAEFGAVRGCPPMSRYELFLFLHVLAAAAWFGAALLSMALLELAARAGELSWLVRFGEFDDSLAKFLFIPASLVTLVAGLVLVFDGPWSFRDDGWVTGGLILLVATFVLGIALIVPTGQKLTEAAKSALAPPAELDAPAVDPNDAGELTALVLRLRLLSWIDVSLLAIVIFLMTVKPF
jgi:uncharacterized membrane protein